MAELPRVVPDKTGFIKVENGTRQIYWEYFGKGEREVVVLLNGVGMMTKSWHRNVPWVYPDYDVLLYDYFGQGNSSQEDEPYFIPGFCDYLVAIMDELGIAKIHPIGVSYGGFIGADLGRLYQQRLHTLTLSGILLTRETQFQMYQDLSLMFYRAPDPPAFELYTYYLYDKIYGEDLARQTYGNIMEKTRKSFYDRYHDKRHSLIRLTEAQKGRLRRPIHGLVRRSGRIILMLRQKSLLGPAPGRGMAAPAPALRRLRRSGHCHGFRPHLPKSGKPPTPRDRIVSPRQESWRQRSNC